MPTERVVFRLIQMPCKCSFMACWVNPRFPNYCPECGEFVFDKVKGGVLIKDEDAILVYHTKKT